MKWENYKFQFKETAELVKKELSEAGIITGDIFIGDRLRNGDGIFYIPLMPIGKKQQEIATHILCEHLW